MTDIEEIMEERNVGRGEATRILREREIALAGENDEPGPLRGIRAQVFRGAYDSTGEHGIKATHVTIVGDDVPGIILCSEDAPPVRVVKRYYRDKPVNYLIPFDWQDGSSMFGGNFVGTSDSRIDFGFYGAMPLHDRRED